MTMNRVRWSVVVIGMALAIGLGSWANWPSPKPALDCEPALVGLDDAGIAHCLAPHPLPAALALTIGQKLDLNTCSAEELALVPGVGLALATRIVEARAALGHFSSWEQVDQVSGVGLNRLETLQHNVQLGEFDAGL